MNLTSIVGKAFKSRQKELLLHQQGAVALQHNVLRNILQQGQNTEYGRRHNLSSVNTYQQFAQSIPLNTYEDLKGDIDRMRQGEKNILWPGTVQWYAKSSGTTNDKSKFIPVSKAGLKNIHYKGGSDCVSLYLENVPNSRMFDGKGLILGGSHSPNYNVKNS